jgi:hypothetical protein
MCRFMTAVDFQQTARRAVNLAGHRCIKVKRNFFVNDRGKLTGMKNKTRALHMSHARHFGRWNQQSTAVVHYLQRCASAFKSVAIAARTSSAQYHARSCHPTRFCGNTSIYSQCYCSCAVFICVTDTVVSQTMHENHKTSAVMLHIRL